MYDNTPSLERTRREGVLSVFGTHIVPYFNAVNVLSFLLGGILFGYDLGYGLSGLFVYADLTEIWKTSLV